MNIVNNEDIQIFIESFDSSKFAVLRKKTPKQQEAIVKIIETLLQRFPVNTDIALAARKARVDSDLVAKAHANRTQVSSS